MKAVNKWGQSKVPEQIIWHLTLTPVTLVELIHQLVLRLDSDSGNMRVNSCAHAATDQAWHAIKGLGDENFVQSFVR
jgi:hypothetical protein